MKKLEKELEEAIENAILELIESFNPFKDLTEEEIKELESEDK